MKLWDGLTTCLVLLSAVRGSSLVRSRQQSSSAERRGRAAGSPLELPPVGTSLSVGSSEARDRRGTLGEEKYAMEELPLSQLEDMVDFIKVTISRMQHSLSLTVSSPTPASTTPKENLSGRTRQRRERKKQGIQQTGKGGRGGAREGKTGRKVRTRGNGRGQGCVLKQIHLNVSDLGLGYLSGEEMIFRYCSGPCKKSETNYDKILYNLAHNKRLSPKDRPSQACCRPIAFDDDLSFLDDNLIYHTMRKHSARRCGCV